MSEIVNLWTGLSFMGGALLGALIYMAYARRAQILYRIGHRRIKAKCPACNGTGLTPISPTTNPFLERALIASGVRPGEQPEFECTNCEGRGAVVYEFKRTDKVEWTEDGRLLEVNPRRVR